MNMELFSNVDEGTNFLNYKAKNRITNLENLCNQDEKDILDYINSCSNIFQKYNKNKNALSCRTYVASVAKSDLQQPENGVNTHFLSQAISS